MAFRILWIHGWLSPQRLTLWMWGHNYIKSEFMCYLEGSSDLISHPSSPCSNSSIQLITIWYGRCHITCRNFLLEGPLQMSPPVLCNHNYQYTISDCPKQSMSNVKLGLSEGLSRNLPKLDKINYYFCSHL